MIRRHHPCAHDHSGVSDSSSVVSAAGSPVPGQLGEVFVNVDQTLPTESQYAQQPYFINPDSAPEFYLENGTGADLALGTPAQTAPNVRQFERDIPASTYTDPYRSPATRVVSYAADQAELGALNMVTADPLRTPTLVVFSPPDDFINSIPAANAVQSSAATSLNEPTAELLQRLLGHSGRPIVMHPVVVCVRPRRFRPRDQRHLGGPGRPWSPPSGGRQRGVDASTSRPRCSTSWACTSPTLPTAVLSAR